MDFKEFTAGKDDDGRRIDKVIRIFISKEKLSGIYKAIRKGLVKVNNKKVQESYHVKHGDSIKIASFLFEKSENNKNTKGNSSSSSSNKELLIKNLNIIFQNEDFLVIDKPYDITVHGSESSLDKIVQEYYDSSAQKKSISFRPGPLHRLDRLTTGILFFSWSINGARWFCQTMKNHNLKKIYLGIFEGKIKKSEEWTDFIEKKEETFNNFHTVSVEKNDKKEAKKALTKVIPLGFGKYSNTDFTFAQIQIFTGRTHQIRAQSASHGFPLLGDIAYGGKKIEAQRQFFLHAQKICFNKENLLGINLEQEINAPLPKDFQDFLENHQFCDYNSSI